MSAAAAAAGGGEAPPAQQHRDPASLSPRSASTPAPSLEQINVEMEQLRTANAALAASIAERDAEITAMRRRVAAAQQAAEVSEDGVAMRMLRRLDAMRREKAAVQHRLRDEERKREMIVAAIARVQAEKGEIENTIEQEQEHIVHDLQRRLLRASECRVELERRLQSERSEYLNVLQERVRAACELAGQDPEVAASPASPASPGAGVGDACFPAGVPALTQQQQQRQRVVALEEGLASLLAAHASECERVRASEQQCTELRELLRQAQIEAMAERNHVAKLRDDLITAQNELAYLQSTASLSQQQLDRSPSLASSSHDPPTSEYFLPSSGASTPVLHGSLVAHTRQILSSASLSCPPHARQGSVSPARSVSSFRDDGAASRGPDDTAPNVSERLQRSRNNSQLQTPPAQPHCMSPPPQIPPQASA